MEYKNTLNLPQTDFPMKADLVTREPQRLEKWQSTNLYQSIQAAREGKPKFVLHDGPPFANGDVHIGTALNKTLKDIIIKYKSLRGFSAPYVPGWDCHGLPIEFKVMQDLRKQFESEWPEKRKEFEEQWNNKPDAATHEAVFKQLELSKFLSPANIRKQCEEYARKYIDIQRTQFKRLGVLGDWDNPYLTLNKEYEADELRLFADIVEKGFVYRAKKPVYWCSVCGTALAEAEVEYADHVSQSVYVKFKIDESHLEGYKEDPNATTAPFPAKKNSYVLIWTTTPWTLPANLAVAYSNNFSYKWIEHETESGPERLLVAASLAESIIQKAALKNATILEQTYSGLALRGVTYHHPFCNRTGKFFAGDAFITSDTGTGFVHIAPGHGMEDYSLGMSVGLPIYSPVGADGKLTHTSDLPVEQQMPAEMLGKTTLEKHGKSDANEAVLHELRLRHALLHQENYHHSYPHCWRSKNPVIFRATDQWFIRIDHKTEVNEEVMADGNVRKHITVGKGTSFRNEALDAISKVNWVPDWGKNRIEGAVKTRPDWCISRQRSWGVPIPAFLDGTTWILNPNIIRRLADRIEEVGSSSWFTLSAAEIYAGSKLQEIVTVTELTSLKKSTDTLDVWIDSGSSSRAVIARRPELRGKDRPFQADMYLEGSDQHRGWFQSSLLLSLAGNGAPPYKTVLTHGFMVDADKEKISKSKQAQGSYEKPQTSEAYIKKYGADVVRLWVASQDYRNDIVVSDERINKVSETYRGIRNTLRYQLSNLYDFDPAKHSVPDEKLTGLDRWILSEFSKLEAEVIEAYDKYEFHVVYQKVSQFIAVELSAIYHDVVKDRLYTDAANSPRRRSTQTTLHRLVAGLCRILSPMLVFTADEAWELVPAKPSASVHLADWQPTDFKVSGAEQEVWKSLFELRSLALPELEKARQAKTIGKGLDAKLSVSGKAPALSAAKPHAEALRELLNVSQLEIKPDAAAELAASVAKADGQKCERCWHWETDVGSNPEHPTICARCVAAVKENLAR